MRGPGATLNTYHLVKQIRSCHYHIVAVSSLPGGLPHKLFLLDDSLPAPLCAASDRGCHMKGKGMKIMSYCPLEIKFQLNWNDYMVPCRQSATAPTLCSPRWATRTRTPTWRDRASWPRSRATWCLSTTLPAFWSVNKFQILTIFLSFFQFNHMTSKGDSWLWRWRQHLQILWSCM